MMNPSPFYTVSCLVVLLLLPLPSLFADPDPIQDLCIADLSASTSVNSFPCKPTSNVTSNDFFFDGLSKEGNTTNIFGTNLIVATILSFRGLNTLALSMIQVDIAIGGVIPPHSHPCAIEAVLVISGQVHVGFMTTVNVYYYKVLIVGHIFVIFEGLVHFQKNVGLGNALFFTSLNSQLLGVDIVSLNLFASTPSIPDNMLTKSFQVGDDVVNSIKSKFCS